jgi:hypothetical protein
MRDVRTHDKVRITRGSSRGERAVVQQVLSKGLLVKLVGSKKLIPVGTDEIVNFSAAARKAWKTMPRRKVGRPPGQTVNRLSVTVRLDRGIWEQFRKLESKDVIKDRSDFLEKALMQAFRRLGGRHT